MSADQCNILNFNVRYKVKTKTYRDFFILNVIALSISGVIFIWLARDGALDFWITGHFFDVKNHIFPFENSSLLENIGHTFLKDLTAFFLIIGIVLSILGFWNSSLRSLRRPLISFCVMAGASALFISFLKATSIHACPWDIEMYGGHLPWLPLFTQLTTHIVPGHCWPGGHASGGFALVAGYFSFKEDRPAWARMFLITGLVFGFVMGFVQIVRGAHFLSHNLWTLWLVWALCFVLDGLIRYISLKVPKRQFCYP
ncbi:phosphatase PAP2 family protein [Herminiimonas fonticola]|nr:phosphatase PAP2 family protein [Herminiimonas fonticola]